MGAYIRSPLTYVWALLTAITVVSWLLSQHSGAEYRVRPLVTIGVLMIAFVKVRFVIWHFMEVRSSPAWLKRTCDGWLLLLAVLVFAFYGLSL